MDKISLARVFRGGLAAGGFSVVMQYIAFLLGAYRKLGEAAGLPLADASFASQLAVVLWSCWSVVH